MTSDDPLALSLLRLSFAADSQEKIREDPWVLEQAVDWSVAGEDLDEGLTCALVSLTGLKERLQEF